MNLGAGYLQQGSTDARDRAACSARWRRTRGSSRRTRRSRSLTTRSAASRRPRLTTGARRSSTRTTPPAANAYAVFSAAGRIGGPTLSRTSAARPRIRLRDAGSGARRTPACARATPVTTAGAGRASARRSRATRPIPTRCSSMMELALPRRRITCRRARSCSAISAAPSDGARALDVLQRRARARQRAGGGPLRRAAPQRVPRLARARAARRAAEAQWPIASHRARRGSAAAGRPRAELLRNARLAQDLTLEQLSTELRIEAKQLNALEENRFERIGVPVFIKGYLKQYGQRLGLDVSDLLALYYKQTTLADVADPAEPHDQAARRAADHVVDPGGDRAAGASSWGSPCGGGAAARRRDGDSQRACDRRRARRRSRRPSRSPPPQPRRRAAPTLESAGRRRQPQRSASAGPLCRSGARRAAATSRDERRRSRRAAQRRARHDPARVHVRAESWAEITDARGERLLFGLSARAARSPCAASRRSRSCSAMRTRCA